MKKLLIPAWMALLFLSSCSGCESQQLSLNSAWLYHQGDAENFEKPQYNDQDWDKVSLPHTLHLEPARFKLSQKYYRGVGLYRLRFSAFGDDYRSGDRALIHFEGALTRADVWLNGKYLGYHLGGYTPFVFDATDAYLPGKENLLAVKVDNSKMNVPPEGFLVDYTLFGGIYRDVWIERKPPVYLEHPFAFTPELNEQKAVLKISADANNTLSEPISCSFTASLWDQVKGKEGMEGVSISEREKELTVPPGSSKAELEMPVENPKLWSPDYPYLYDLNLKISCPDLRKKSETKSSEEAPEMSDLISFHYGFRWFKFTDRGFFLNGKRLQLFGLNRHQSYPYLGNAASFRLQYLDALLLKQSGLNFVRLSHYPQSPDFLDACDHLGLMAFEELPGWGFVGNREWKKVAEQSLREMILRDRNRPSIILWGVRVNEAWWGEKWLEQMIRPAHELDPTRPASGARFVRNFRHLREEVIAHNDYSGGLLKPPGNKPWIVSEYSVGAPTLTDALQIATVRQTAYMLDLIQSEPSCSGSTGWVFADYNTFMTRLAAPDAKYRIRRHGIVDLYRLKKPSYYFFQAQTSETPMVKIINQWWQKPDFPGEVMAVGNCDQVRLTINHKEIATRGPDKKYLFPRPGEYQTLSRPPFTFSGFKFEPGELAAQCLIKGEVRAEDRLQTPGAPAKIILELGEEFNRIEPDIDALIPYQEYSDPIRVIARLVDAEGNPVKENKLAVRFEISGPGEIIGENPFRLENGVGVALFRLLSKVTLESVTLESATTDKKIKDLPEKEQDKILLKELAGRKEEIQIRAGVNSGKTGIEPAELSLLIFEFPIPVPANPTDQEVDKIIEQLDQIQKDKAAQKSLILDRPQEDLFTQPEIILRKMFEERDR